MSRWLVTGVFAVLTVATAWGAANVTREAVDEPLLRSWAEAGYSVLRLAVVAAFTVFVFVRKPSRRPSREPLAFAACAAAIVAVVALEPPPASVATHMVIVGDLIAFGWCAWLLVSVFALGRCFGVLPEVRGLVTRGPYRIVRHPVYLGEFGAVVGLLIAAPTAANAGLALLFAIAQVLRSRLEEAALTEEFPEYREYAARTPRFLPRLRPSAPPRVPAWKGR
jgi:protein-S-isoprenylcysteine O-methyltransferase Ste14